MSDRSPARPRRFPVRCQGPCRLARGQRPAPDPSLALAPLPTTETHAWSRGLWGRFLPDRRRQARTPAEADAA